ncbi:MAG: hypothetical protein DMF50_05595 [Acidobacteria bacterium]|nr:MAG: hypothetical protein DMF50_05595 [Acidobacteriota bacterium]
MIAPAAAAHGPLLFIVLSALALIAAGGALLLVIAGGRLDLHRSVLVRVPAGEAWRVVRSLPTLYAAHGRAHSGGGLETWALQRGDGEAAGSIWRAAGRWGGVPYWAELEVVLSRPGRELAVRLMRDSLGTHRGLKSHLGSLTLEAVDPQTTKISWRLRTRLRGTRLRALRLLSRARLQARLFDPSLRSIKIGLERAGAAPPGSAELAPPAAAASERDATSPGSRRRPEPVPPPPPPRRPPEAGV